MLDEAAGFGDRVVAKILRVIVFVSGDGNGEVGVVLLAQIQIEKPLVVCAVVAAVIPVSE